MNSTLAILAVLDGISYAALVFLVSVGLSLIFGVLRVVNVAHGSLYAFGAYLAATFSLVIAQVSPWLTYPALLAASIVIGVVCGGFIERFLLRPLYGRDDVLQLLITFAAFMIMDNLQRLIWGVQPIFAAEPLKLLPNISVFGVNYTSYQVLLLPAVALATLFGLRYFLRRTLAGAVILAVTEDREASTAIGIDAQRVLLRDIRHRREPCRARRGVGLADHIARARHGRRHDCALLCGGGDRRSGADRGHRTHRADDRPDPRLCHLFAAGVRSPRALFADGAGAAGASVWTVRGRPGEKNMMAGRIKPITAVAIVFFLVSAVAPLFVASWATLFALILAKGIVVLGIVLLLQAGQVSFGHAMFFATGAYTAAFWGKYIGGGDILLFLLLGGVTSTIVGLIVGLFVVRYREIFFGMLNLAFSMVLWSLLEKMFHYTNGADGIRVARPGLLGFSFTPETFQYVILYVSLVVAVVAFYGVQRYLDSPLGHMLRAMKSNETRLEYLGMSARRVLLIGYVISAFLGGIGGTLVSIIQQIATPEFGFWTKSGEFVFIAILGGGAHAFGAFAGAAMFECVRFYAAAHLADSWQLILGVVLIVIILYAPNGLIGLRQRYGQARQGEH